MDYYSSLIKNEGSGWDASIDIPILNSVTFFIFPPLLLPSFIFICAVIKNKIHPSIIKHIYQQRISSCVRNGWIWKRREKGSFGYCSSFALGCSRHTLFPPPPSVLSHTTDLVPQSSAFVRTEHVTTLYLMLRLNYDQCFAVTLLAALTMM